jgi:hypothetical protein
MWDVSFTTPVILLLWEVASCPLDSSWADPRANISTLEETKISLSPTRNRFTRFWISNFRCVPNVVCSLLGNSPVSELYMPTFRNTLSVPSSYAGRCEEWQGLRNVMVFIWEKFGSKIAWSNRKEGDRVGTGRVQSKSYLHTVHTVQSSSAQKPCLPHQQEIVPYVVKISVLRFWRWVNVCPKHVELILEINKTVIVASSWCSIFTYLHWWCTVKHKSNVISTSNTVFI